MNIARASGGVPLDRRSTLANVTCARKRLIALNVLWITSDRILDTVLLFAMVNVEPRGGKSFSTCGSCGLIICAASNASSPLDTWKTIRFAGIRSPTALTGARHLALYQQLVNGIFILARSKLRPITTTDISRHTLTSKKNDHVLGNDVSLRDLE